MVACAREANKTSLKFEILETITQTVAHLHVFFDSTWTAAATPTREARGRRRLPSTQRDALPGRQAGQLGAALSPRCRPRAAALAPCHTQPPPHPQTPQFPGLKPCLSVARPVLPTWWRGVSHPLSVAQSRPDQGQYGEEGVNGTTRPPPHKTHSVDLPGGQASPGSNLAHSATRHALCFFCLYFVFHPARRTAVSGLREPEY